MARHQIAVFALAAIAIASSFWALLDFISVLSKEAPTFGVGAFEKRFEALHKALPPHSVLGYVSDNPVNDEVTSQGEFYLTQYTLVPALIKADLNEPVVVGNFHTEPPGNLDYLKAMHLVDAGNYGYDIHLYRHSTQ